MTISGRKLVRIRWTLRRDSDRCAAVAVVRDCRRGKLALEVGNFQRFEPEALARHNLVFHAVFRADKQNAAAGLALLKQPRHRQWLGKYARRAAAR